MARKVYALVAAHGEPMVDTQVCWTCLPENPRRRGELARELARKSWHGVWNQHAWRNVTDSPDAKCTLCNCAAEVAA